MYKLTEYNVQNLHVEQEYNRTAFLPADRDKI